MNCKSYEEIVDSIESPTYADILEACDWKVKRTQIVERDHHKCINCQNKKVVQDCLTATVNEYYYLNLNTIAALLTPTLPPYMNKLCLFDNGRYNLQGGNLIYFKPGVINFILFGCKLENTENWLYAKGLCVHHTYYQDGLLPWDYPDEDLQTLCTPCHENLHDTVQIPRRDINGIEIGYVTPCPRCFGTGFLEQYDFYRDGICFQCNGARYIELIT